MKFETILFAAAFLILALISLPEKAKEETSDTKTDPAAVETPIITVAASQEEEAAAQEQPDTEEDTKAPLP